MGSRSKNTPVVAVADYPRPDILAVRPPVAQQILGVGETTFWRLVKAGEIEVVSFSPTLSILSDTARQHRQHG